MGELLTGADISDCDSYRYRLWRRWNEDLPTCTWVMLNPSTADATEDDPTIRRCMDFAKRWGFGGIVVVNLFALRATDPSELKTQPNPVGPDNDQALFDAALVSGRLGGQIVVAWGAKCRPHRGLKRDRAVLAILRAARTPAANERNPILCLGKTKAGFPRHPLYLAGTTKPEAYGEAPA